MRDVILRRDLLIELGPNLKFSDQIIEADDRPLKGSTTTMVDLDTYEFRILNTRKIIPEVLFTNAYVK